MNSFISLASGVTSTSYITTVSLQGNRYYQFKVLSRNSFGFSTSFSNIVNILTAILPDSPVNLANNVAVTASGTIGLTWAPGIYNGGSPIIDYRISYHNFIHCYKFDCQHDLLLYGRSKERNWL